MVNVYRFFLVMIFSIFFSSIMNSSPNEITISMMFFVTIVMFLLAMSSCVNISFDGVREDDYRIIIRKNFKRFRFNFMIACLLNIFVYLSYPLLPNQMVQIYDWTLKFNWSWFAIVLSFSSTVYLIYSSIQIQELKDDIDDRTFDKNNGKSEVLMVNKK